MVRDVLSPRGSTARKLAFPALNTIAENGGLLDGRLGPQQRATSGAEDE
jgi:hypothetical protein